MGFDISKHENCLKITQTCIFIYHVLTMYKVPIIVRADISACRSGQNFRYPILDKGFKG